MYLGIFTVFTSFLWFNIFMLFVVLLRRQQKIYRNFSVGILLIAVILCISKMFFVFEFPFTVVINSTKIMTTVQYILSYTVFSISIPNIEIYISVGELFLIFSLTVSVVIILKKIYRNVMLYKLFKFLPQTDNTYIVDTFLFVKDMVNINKKMKIVVHSRVRSPAIVGYFNPIIILPQLEFEKNELIGIFAHELMHYKNKHLFIKFIVESVNVFMWWNPLVYVFRNEVSNILEFHADKKLTIFLDKQVQFSYLEGILKVVENYENKKKFLPMTAGLAERGNDNVIKQRFTMILENNYSKNKKIINIALLFPMLCVFFISYMFVIQPFSEPTEEFYNDNAPIVEKDSYIILNESNYTIYDKNGKFLATNSYPVSEDFYYVKIRGKE